MRQKFTFWTILLMISFGAIEANAQRLVIKTKAGTENFKELNTLKSFTFSNNNLLINYIGGSTDSYSLSSVGKIYFNSEITRIGNNSLNSAVEELVVYPNPVQDMLYLQNTPEGTFNVTIYRMDVVPVFSTQVSSGNKSIDVSHLASGLYLLKVNNQTCKFIKL